MASPDHDVYVEDLTGEDDDIAAVRFAAGRQDLPRGLLVQILEALYFPAVGSSFTKWNTWRMWYPMKSGRDLS